MRSRSTTHRRGRRERGAALIEFALVLPFLALMLFGTAEMGLGWVANNRVEGATSTAARVGSAVGADANADRTILVALKAALPAEQLANLDRVAIFKPATASGGIPADCIPAKGSPSQAGVPNCNSYTGATVRSVTSTTNLGAADDQWPGTTAARHDSLAFVGGPDYIGLYVRTTYKAKTGTFFSDRTIVKTSIYRIQPDING